MPESAKPWYASPGLLGNSTKLCHTCLHINFAWLLEHDFNGARYAHWQANRFAPIEEDVPPVKIPWVSEHRVVNFPDLSLGFLFEILERSEHCCFCRLVSFTIAIAYRIEPEALSTRENFDHAPFQHVPYHFVFCTLSNRKREDHLGGKYDIVINICDIQRDILSSEQVLLHQIRDDLIVPFAGRSVGPFVDFPSIERWLAHFENSICSDATIPGFRLIGVVDRNIVLVHNPGAYRYLCLSYVWGGPQLFQNVKAISEELQTPGSLLQRQLPQTIEDAIQFTAKSGERYLWVDSLCIVQDDGDAKMIQINAMDSIYSCAIATIINSDGISCHSGLPGVADVPREWKQITVNLGGIVLANKYEQKFVRKQNHWHNRGWTSKNIEDGMIEEDMHHPRHQERLEWTRTGFPVGDSVPEMAFVSNIILFAWSIGMYSSRSLTFNSDTINAFQGVLNIHRPRFRREFLFAMPSSELELMLLWQPASVLLRRVDSDEGRYPFPSWSWVAWKGHLVLPVEGAARFSRIMWVDALDMTTRFTSDEWRGAQPGAWQIVPDRGVGMAPWYFEESDPDARFAHPISQDIPSAMQQRQFLKPGSHVLTFYALRAHVSAIPSDRSLQNPHDPNAAPPEGVQSYTLQDRFRRFCGMVNLHAVNPELNTNLLNCVVISRTTYGSKNVSHDDPPSDDSDVVSIRDEYAERAMLRKKSDERSAANYLDVYEFELKWQAYAILVIARGSDGTAERVGVGLCLCEAVWDADPMQEKIQLR